MTFWTSGWDRRWPGDIDNLAKSVLDGLKQVAYEDDRQVLRLVGELRETAPGQERVFIRMTTLNASKNGLPEKAGVVDASRRGR